ncbi:MAG: type II toxin-antitoxin system RelB/DinJ family antitoxin [Nitrospirota bacterium]|nr:type II toxin-antitoxin system RelB/DinJ family antitoxin [Nitrospirota bacterium]
MARTAMIRARITPDLKEEVEFILKRLGLTTTEAINIFFSQVKLQRGLPFEVKIPNKTTLKTFKKTDESKELVKCRDLDDMFKKLAI